MIPVMKASKNNNVILCSVVPSSRRDKKLVATFMHRKTGRMTRTHFGGRGCGDYIKYSTQSKSLGKKKREAYIARHGATEKWTDPTTAASLSRYILWEYTSLPYAIKRYMSHFK
jgi:hypothetical protein